MDVFNLTKRWQITVNSHIHCRIVCLYSVPLENNFLVEQHMYFHVLFIL